MTRVGKLPGKVGATRSDGGTSEEGTALDGVVPLVVLSPGRPMSVVDSRTVGYEVLVDDAEVVFATCGAWGMYVPGGTTESFSEVFHLLDIVTTAVTRIAISASPRSPAADVAAAERYHGVVSGGMAADPSCRARRLLNRRLVVR
mgnify:CR=1 FL=1